MLSASLADINAALAASMAACVIACFMFSFVAILFCISYL